MIIIWILILLLIFYLLAKICDEFFVESLDFIIERLKLSPDVAGATFMAIGSSAPELFTSIAALSKVNAESVGAGTIVGSAIFNILMIVGASATVATAYLHWKPVIRDLLFYIMSIGILLFTFWDGIITLYEAWIFIGGYALYLFILAFWGKWIKKPNEIKGKDMLHETEATVEKIEHKLESKGPLKYFAKGIDIFFLKIFPDLKKNPQYYMLTFLIAILFIAGLSWIMVEVAVILAESLNISETIIALTILAGGTSIPDMISSVIVAKQGRGGMAISNAVGSNTFDILIGLGMPWLVFILWKKENVHVGTDNLLSSIWLLFATVVTLLFVLIIQKFKIGKYSGFFLIGLYVLYLGLAIYRAIYPDAFINLYSHSVSYIMH